MKLCNAIHTFLEEQAGVLAPSTITWYRQRFEWLSPLHDKPLAAITPGELRALWQKLARGMSPYTGYMIVVAWRRLFNWCVQRGHLTRSPAAQLKKPPLPDEPPKAIRRRDMLKMLDASQANSDRDYALLCLLIDTGARVDGLATLRLGDLDLDRRRAVVHEKGLGGHRRSRTIHMKRRTVEAIRAWLRVRDLAGKTVFGLGHSGIAQMLQRTAQRAAVRGRVNPHAFRHAFARELLDAGADLATVSQLMGHRSIEVTARFYARWSDAELHRKHEKYSPLPD